MPRWQCDVTLTEGELAQVDRWTARQAAAGSSSNAGWRLFGLAVASGFAGGILAVLLHLVRPGAGGGITVIAFLAFLAGSWGHYRMAVRAAKRARRTSWAEIGGRYRLAIDGNGLEWAVLSQTSRSTTWLDWGGLARVDAEEGFLIFQTRRGNALYLPVRALPAGCTAAALVAAADQAVRRSQGADAA